MNICALLEEQFVKKRSSNDDEDDEKESVLVIKKPKQGLNNILKEKNDKSFRSSSNFENDHTKFQQKKDISKESNQKVQISMNL